MAGYYNRTLMDYDGEVSTVSTYATQLSEANMAAQITLQSNFGAAINDMSLGALQKIEYGNRITSNTPAPANTWAQRELKWRVDFHDAVTNEPGYFTIPCANTALLDPNHRGVADMTNADVIDFVTAAEAYVLSKDANAIAIDEIVLVGRNT